MSRMLTLALLLAACGPKEPTTTSAVAEASPAESANTAPPDADSQTFAKKLFATEFTNFHPVDGAGAELIYSSFSFHPDGTWAANGSVTVADESMDCRESGTWTMEPAESADVASVGWKITDTNCAGRDSGTEMRFRLTLKKAGDYEYSFR